MWDVQAYLMHIMLNIGQSGTFLISHVTSLQMAQLTENVGALIASNRNSISPLDLRVKWIKVQMGPVRGNMWHAAVNEGLWLAFVKTRWSSYMLKVTPPLWHPQMKTFHFFRGGGDVMIWIKIVRLAVNSYHRRLRLIWPFQGIVIFRPCDATTAQRGGGPPSSPAMQFVLGVTVHSARVPANRPNTYVSAEQQAVTAE